jgi:hypothetical protein
MAIQNIVAHSGNLITLELDGQRFGTIQRMSCSDAYNPESVSGVGDIHSLEFVPSLAQHTITVEHAVLKVGAMRSLGVIGENGTERLKGMEFDIVIYEKNPQSSAIKELRKYRYCSYASGTINISAHRVVMSDATFNSRDVTGTGI